jgi:hypothetical protein
MRAAFASGAVLGVVSRIEEWSGCWCAAITRQATSSTHARSIARDERTPRAQQ